MRDVPLPSGLHDRLLAGLPLANGEGSWYRRRSVQAACVAAAALIALVGWQLWVRIPVQLDLASRYEHLNNPPNSAEEALQSLQRQGFHAELPPNITFNFNLLAYCGPGLLQEKRVPVLEFQKGSATLRVYILDGQRFELNSLQGQSGLWSLEPWLVPGSRFGWLFEYTGGSLEPFKAPNPLPAT
jgi:hypothetical protein